MSLVVSICMEEFIRIQGVNDIIHCLDIRQHHLSQSGLIPIALFERC